MSESTPVLKARFVVIDERHQVGQFQELKVPTDPKQGMKTEFEPIVGVKLVAQSKIDGP
ncbi:MAG TPA: hypothetical protein VGH91_04565 [Gammaproteobacteria bacterium]|jgi:hypothetical protein